MSSHRGQRLDAPTLIIEDNGATVEQSMSGLTLLGEPAKPVSSCHRRYDRVAELYAEAGGALYIEAVIEKSGQSGNEGDVEQYDAVIPVPPVVIEEARYLDRYWSRARGDGRPALPRRALGRWSVTRRP